MKFVHISDLHIGKTMNQISLYEDQRYILLEQIYKVIEEEKADALLIAGDVYDWHSPTKESMDLFDEFINKVLSINVKVFVIAGNHDSITRISHHKEILKHGGFYVSGGYDSKLEKVTLKDEYGDIDFYLLPFLTPEMVSEKIDISYDSPNRYDQAIDTVIKREDIDTTKRNVILSHQMVTGAIRSQSDSLSSSITTSDVVSIHDYDPFDYVALGHIHKSMTFFDKRVVYPGAILPYHSDESNERYVSVVSLKEKGNIDVRLVPIYPKRKVIKLIGSEDALLRERPNSEDLISITLIGDIKHIDIATSLKKLFPHMIQIQRLAEKREEQRLSPINETLSSLDLIKRFYEEKAHKKIDKEDLKIIEETYNQVIKGD